MGTIQQLIGLGIITSGCIRILAAYVLFIALTLLNSRPYVRHALWLLFLTTAGSYWVILAMHALQPIHFTAHAIRSFAVDKFDTSSGAMTITIPFSWSGRLELISVALVCAYVGGLTIMLFRLVQRRRLLRKAITRARPVSHGSYGRLETSYRYLGISRCQILELPGLESPGTAYTWRPLILLPDGLDVYLDNEGCVDVLYHELIHIRRLDFLWNTLGELVGCVLFFHPVVWLALSKLGRERELACDEAVMNLRPWRRTDYAFCLTRMARRRVLGCQLETPSHLALLDSFLALRVQTLLKENRPRIWGQQGAAISAALFAVFIFFAGWPSLSLGIELAQPVRSSTPIMARERYPAASEKRRAGGAKPHAFSAKTSQLPPNPPDFQGGPPEPRQKMPQAAQSENIDALIDPPQGGSHVSSRADNQSPFDETPPPTLAKSPVSWRRNVMGAAISALEHVALGGKDGDKDESRGGGGRNPGDR